MGRSFKKTNTPVDIQEMVRIPEIGHKKTSCMEHCSYLMKYFPIQTASHSIIMEDKQNIIYHLSIINTYYQYILWNNFYS